MRVSFSLPFSHSDGNSYNAEEVMAMAKHVEDSGFDGIWIGDTVSRGREPRPDPLMWLLVAAVATKRVELGTAVMQVPLRRPVELAQRFLTIHALTGGRFAAGVGAGSTAADFESADLSYEDRFKTFNHDLKLIRRLCSGEVVGTADLKPWPNALGGPPLLIGAWASGLWVKRSARDYDGWLTSGGGPGGTTFGNLVEGIKIYRDYGGKRAIVATVGCDLHGESPAMTLETRFVLRCPPDEAVERLLKVAELGYDEVLLRNDYATFEDVTEVANVVNRMRNHLGQ